MKCSFLILLVLSFLPSLSLGQHRSAFGDWSGNGHGIETGQENWKKYFAGTPLITDALPFYESQMNIDHEACGPGAKLILSLVSDYRTQIIGHNVDLAKQTYEIILRTMKSTKNKGCRRAYKGAYAIGSAFLPFWLNEDPTQLNISTSQYGVKSYVFRSFYYIPTQNGLKTLFLFNRNKLHFLPRGHKNGILGAYDCDSSDIYIAVDQNPYDVGSTLLHEMSHLYRDKFVPLMALQKLYPYRGKSMPRTPILDWRTYILVDELLASADATFSEETVEFDFRASLSPPFSNLPFNKTVPLKINDFSFVAPDRPLEKFTAWTHHFLHYAVLLGRVAVPSRVFAYDSSDPTSTDGKKEIRVNDGGPDFTKSPQEAMNAYNGLLLQDYEIISRGYLNMGLTESQKDILKLKYKPDWDVSYDMLWAHMKYDLGSDDEYIYDTAFDKPLIEFEYVGVPNEGQSDYAQNWIPVNDLFNRLRNADWQYETYYDDVDKLFKDFDKLDSKFGGPSDQCLDFRKAIEAGQLDHYLGNTMRPGNGGKTGTPVKLGNGGKTGTDIKPGNGAKTSTTIRPCILPSEKL